MSTTEERSDASGTAGWPDWHAGHTVAKQAGTELPI
jgi:hypothetical protein